MSLSWDRPFWVICKGQCGHKTLGLGPGLGGWVEVGRFSREDAFSSFPQANSWEDPIPPKRGFLKLCWPASLVVSVPPSHHSLEVHYRTNVYLCMCIKQTVFNISEFKKKSKLYSRLFDHLKI